MQKMIFENFVGAESERGLQIFVLRHEWGFHINPPIGLVVDSTGQDGIPPMGLIVDSTGQDGITPLGG